MEKNLRQESSEVKRVVICGPESTGKSTLTQNLASHYNTSFAKEFARDFLQDKWDISNTVSVSYTHLTLPTNREV